MSQEKKLTILAAPYNAVGPVNAARGALSCLQARGHRIIFVLQKTFKGKLASHGYEEHVIESENKNKDSKKEEKPGEAIAKGLFERGVFGPYTPKEKLERFIEFCKTSGNTDEVGAFEDGLKEAIGRYKPDLIYVDCGVLWPSIYYSGIPWIRQVSCAPTYYIIDDEASFPPS